MPINILSQNGQMVRKPTLTAAFTDADTAGKTVVITGPVTAGTMNTGGRSLEIKQGGVITIPTGATLTINGPFQAGLYQVFDGDGSVVFGSGSVSEVYPEWWGAIADGVTDCSASIEAANSSAAINNMEVRFVSGTYLINTSISWSTSLNWVGAGKSKTYIKAGSAITAMLSGSTTIGDTGLTKRTHIHGVSFDGSSLANYAIRGVTNHSTFENFRVTGTTTKSIYTGYGWCNLFDNLEINYNTGDGIDVSLGGQSNSNTISNCRVFFNDGIGILVFGAIDVKIVGCTIESNKTSGVFVNYSNMVSIDTCYFEANSITGYTFTSPSSINIKSDIIVNGSGTPTAIAVASPSTVDVRACTVSSSYTNYFVYAPGSASTVIDNNHCGLGTPILLGAYGSSTASPSYGDLRGMDIRSNYGFVTKVDISPMPTTLNYTSPYQRLDLSKPNINIAEVNLEKWFNVFTGVGGSFWQRSAQTFDSKPSLTVYESGAAVTGTSSTYGFQINVANYPQYQNKYVSFSVWVKGPFVGDGYVGVLCGGAISSSNENNTGWVLKQGLVKFGTSGTWNFGVYKSGAAGTFYATAPVLSELGTNINTLVGQQVGRTTFYLSAAPTIGTWKLGDRVVNTSPAVGQPKGWICTVAGTPGTWVSEGNL